MTCESERIRSLSGVPDQAAVRLSASQDAATGEPSVSAASRLVSSVETPTMRQIVKFLEQRELSCITLTQGCQNVPNAGS